ncbi:MAG: type II toxin-antitoxin system ParD family antitoxin [Thermoguttaceae bacterium]|jgi:antitoxin ParD1/3/4
MVFTMPSDLDAFVHQAVASGAFASEEDVIVAALRLLQEREKRLEELRAELIPSIEELDRGEGKPLDIEEIIAGAEARHTARKETK